MLCIATKINLEMGQSLAFAIMADRHEQIVDNEAATFN